MHVGLIAVTLKNRHNSCVTDMFEFSAYDCVKTCVGWNIGSVNNTQLYALHQDKSATKENISLISLPQPNAVKQTYINTCEIKISPQKPTGWQCAKKTLVLEASTLQQQKTIHQLAWHHISNYCIFINTAVRTVSLAMHIRTNSPKSLPHRDSI